ncbi:MAG: type II 3-dehydroquinate dehydratase [Quadrisphaera sp.]
MTAPVFLLNGPNLGRLGLREPAVYGATTLPEIEARCTEVASQLGLELTCRQTDTEGQMIGWVHEAADLGAGVVLNPAGWTHTSVALRDACAQLTAPLVEVHLTNVHAREPFRAHSYISPVAAAVVAGMGPEGYLAALRYLAGHLSTD